MRFSKPDSRAEFVNLLDERLAAFVLRMRFAGENELHRPRGVVEQLVQAILIAEQERAAFVGGETSRKTDRQNFRIENAIGRREWIRAIRRSRSR